MSSVSENRTAEELRTLHERALASGIVERARVFYDEGLSQWRTGYLVGDLSAVFDELTALRAKAARMEEALDAIFLHVSYINTHDVVLPSGGPQPVRPGKEEMWTMLQRIGKLATASLSEGTERKDQPTEE